MQSVKYDGIESLRIRLKWPKTREDKVTEEKPPDASLAERTLRPSRSFLVPKVDRLREQACWTKHFDISAKITQQEDIFSRRSSLAIF